MSPAVRLLQSISSGASTVVKIPEPETVDSDVVVILAALLCALICIVGLALLARCAWLRPLPPNKGLKKELGSLPTTSCDAVGAAVESLADCPICLAEFAQGDEIRILPQCGHGFHVSCVDIWLGSHSSCPSCRQILIVAPLPRCCLCGAGDGAASMAIGAKPSEEDDANKLLP